jgi:hypothetical protein
VTLLDVIEKIVGKERVATVVNEIKTPGIIKVRNNVEGKASYQNWIVSDEYKKIDTKTTSFVQNNHPELFN